MNEIKPLEKGICKNEDKTLLLIKSKIIYAFLQQILFQQENDDEKFTKKTKHLDTWYLINAKNLCKQCGLDETKFYMVFQVIKENIQNQFFYMQGDIADVAIRWIDAFAFDTEDGNWHIHISDLAETFIKNFRKIFSAKILESFMNYKTILGFRLHGIFVKELAERNFPNERKTLSEVFTITFSFDTLRELSMSEKEIDFEKDVLFPAIEEINRLKYFYVDIKKGKSAITFFVKVAEKNTKVEEIIKEENEKIKKTRISKEFLKTLLIQKFGLSSEEWLTIKNKSILDLLIGLSNTKTKMLLQNVSKDEITSVGKKILLHEIDLISFDEAEET